MTPEPTVNLLNSLSLFGGAQGIILACMLLHLKGGNKQANRYLAIVLTLASLTLLHQFSRETGYIYKAPYLLNTLPFLQIIIPPAFYLYIHTMTAFNNNTPSWLWIIVPILVMWVIQLPIYTTDFETKLALANNTYTFRDLSLLLKAAVLAFSVLSILSFTIWIALSFKLLFAHTKNIAHFFSYRESIELAWIRNLLLVMAFFWLFTLVLYIFLPFFGMETELQTIKQTQFMYAWLKISLVVAIFYCGVRGLLQPRIYKPSDFEATEPQAKEADGLIRTNKAHKNKYQKSALNQSQSEKILNDLLGIMESQQPYLQNNLTLRDLASLLSTQPHYLSQVINEQLQMSFFDYINYQRIETAKKLLITPRAKRQTVLDVAMASAFNSKSVFYSAFKKHTGITPAQYQKNHT